MTRVTTFLSILAMVLVSLTTAARAQSLEPPAGSYQGTCVQIIVQRLIGGNGRSLEARCPNRSGQYVDAALALPCRGDIQNQNGRLICAADPDPFSPPRGSYNPSAATPS